MGLTADQFARAVACGCLWGARRARDLEVAEPDEDWEPGLADAHEELFGEERGASAWDRDGAALPSAELRDELAAVALEAALETWWRAREDAGHLEEVRRDERERRAEL